MCEIRAKIDLPVRTGTRGARAGNFSPSQRVRLVAGQIVRSPSAGLAAGLGEEGFDHMFHVLALALRTLDLLRLMFLDGQHFIKLRLTFAANVFIERHRFSSTVIWLMFQFAPTK